MNRILLIAVVLYIAWTMYQSSNTPAAVAPAPAAANPSGGTQTNSPQGLFEQLLGEFGKLTGNALDKAQTNAATV